MHGQRWTWVYWFLYSEIEFNVKQMKRMEREGLFYLHQETAWGMFKML